MAGALHDRGRATLVGTTTFGKGTVQQWTQLEDDRGGFRLTIAKWLTPDRTWVHGTGIEPDVVVEQAPEKPGDDPVLDAALEELGEAARGRWAASTPRERTATISTLARSGVIGYGRLRTKGGDVQ